LTVPLRCSEKWLEVEGIRERWRKVEEVEGEKRTERF